MHAKVDTVSVLIIATIGAFAMVKILEPKTYREKIWMPKVRGAIPLAWTPPTWTADDKIGAGRMLVSEDSDQSTWPYLLAVLRNAADYYYQVGPSRLLKRVGGKDTPSYGKQDDPGGRWAGSSKAATDQSLAAVDRFISDPTYSEAAREAIGDSISFAEGRSYVDKLTRNNPELELKYAGPQGSKWFFMRDKRRPA